MEWSWTAWLASVGAVLVSAFVAWREGNWSRRPGLGMGFREHGGMWSDLVLLSMANAAIVPHLSLGVWIPLALVATTLLSLWVHAHWYGPRGSHKQEAAREPQDADSVTSAGAASSATGDHMWPSRAASVWWRDLSWAGWAHVVYVAGELALLIGFAIHEVPDDVVLFVAAIFTVHVPIGLLQPRYFLTGHIATAGEQPLLLPSLVGLWAVIAAKL